MTKLTLDDYAALQRIQKMKGGKIVEGKVVKTDTEEIMPITVNLHGFRPFSAVVVMPVEDGKAADAMDAVPQPA